MKRLFLCKLDSISVSNFPFNEFIKYYRNNHVLVAMVTCCHNHLTAMLTDHQFLTHTPNVWVTGGSVTRHLLSISSFRFLLFNPHKIIRIRVGMNSDTNVWIYWRKQCSNSDWPKGGAINTSNVLIWMSVWLSSGT